MVKVINISTSGDFVLADKILTNLSKRFPAMTIQAMRKWGKKLEQDTKLSLESSTSNFTGDSLKKGIEWKQGKKSYVGSLFIKQKYVYLDSMSPHWVNVKRTRSVLLSWAKQAKIPNIRSRAKLVESGKLKKFGIFVKPRPFIDRGFNRARPKLNPILREMAVRALN